jgi:transcriptional regulator with XRE-family HTH domain
MKDDDNLIKEGKFIRDTRKATGLSQVELSRLLGTSQSKLSKIEKGSLRIGVREWFLFCKFTNVPVLLYWEFLPK